MIKYIKENGHIQSLQLGRHIIPLVSSQPPGCVFSAPYTREELSEVMASPLCEDTNYLSFYLEPFEGLYKLYIGETSYKPFQQVLSNQIYGYVIAYREFKQQN